MINVEFDGLRKMSLLWPDLNKKEEAAKKEPLKSMSYFDIGLENVVDRFGVVGTYKDFVENTIKYMCEDIDVINYRLDIIDDIYKEREVREAIDKLYTLCCDVEKLIKTESITVPDVQKLASSFRETDIFGNSIDKAKEILELTGDKLKAKGLNNLREEINRLSQDFAYSYRDEVQNSEKDIREVGNEYMKLESITLGVNLDNDLRPVEATIVSINDVKYTKAPFLNRFKKGVKSEFDINYELHSKVEDKLSRRIVKEIDEMSESMVRIDSSSLQLTLLSDLERTIKNISSPLRDLIKRYTSTYLGFFVSLKYELLFYQGAIRIIELVRSNGMPMCRPVAEPKEMRTFNVEGMYNINLALRLLGKPKYRIIRNDVKFTPEGSIFVLTGPNSGGKTTFINAISLIQVMFQAGLYVPADSAVISPVDNIYTHFSSEEKRDTDYGRLGEESKRLAEIFKQATKYSLISLNESLASTSPGECLIMSRDVLYGLKYLNAHAIFATHQHELGSGLDDVNKKYPGEGIIKSLVIGQRKEQDDSGETRYVRTYKVVEAPPEGTSYAKDIADSFGISYEAIKKTLRERFNEQ